MMAIPKLTKRMLVMALVVVLFGALSLAQSTTDGAIAGTVYDTNGAVIANANVVIHNNGTNAEVTTTTDATGYFRVSHLQPGTYTVSVSEKGFSAYKAPQVVVQVGSITEVTPKLGVGGVTETVDVSGEAPQINYVSPEFAPTLNQTAISNLPINGGRWSNFTLLTPGVVSDANAFGLLSFRGISTLLNNNTVDGADNNQAFFSEERGRTRAGYSTPKVAIQEFQVNTSNYSAEYGRSAGGVINTVTKSGTNAIHGETYFYDRDNVWGAANPFTQIAVQTAPGVFTPTNFKPTDWRKMAGFGVGGPLMKDKLFWFVAFDWYRHNFPGTAVTSNPNAFFALPTCVGTAPWTSGTLCSAGSQVGTLATRVLPGGNTIANDALVGDPTTGIWAKDIAGLNTMLGLVPRTGDQTIVFPRLDWIINSKNHASFSFNRMRWSSPAGIQTAATVTRGIASFGNDYVKDTWGVAKLNTLFTSNLANEARFQYGRDFEFEFSQPPSPYELANLVNAPTFTNPLGLPPTVSITNGFTFGVPNFLQRSFFPDETRMQIADTVTWTHGKHNFKFGMDFSHVNDNSQNLFNGFGSYSYSTLTDYFSDFNKPNACAGIPCYSNFSQGLGLPGVEFSTNDYAWFAADDWKINSRLSLSLGVRYEYQQLPNTFPSLVNPAVPQTVKFPTDKNNFGPRIGFALDAFGDGKTVVRGGYGMYYGRVINSTIFSALTGTGAPGSQVSLSFTPTSPGAPVFPAILTSLSGVGKNIVFFDPHFQNPQIHEMDMTVEQDLGHGTVLSLSYLGSLGRELPDFVDTNVPLNNIGAVTYKVVNGGPLGTGPYTTQLFKPFCLNPPLCTVTQQRPNSAFGSMTDIISGVNSSYHALAVQLNHRMSHHIQFSANYTWAHAMDFGQNQTTFTSTNLLLFPNTIRPEKGNSQYDVPNRFVLHAVLTSPWKHEGWMGWFANDWEFAPVYQIQNGLPYTLSVSGNAPGGAIGSINGSGGSNRIDVLGNNSFRQPMTWLTDMRVAKSFHVHERYRIELLADFFNIPNKQNVMGVNNSGYSIKTSGTIPVPVGPAVACSNAAPCLSFKVNNAFTPLFGSITSVNNSNFLYTPRQIQLGARVHF